MKFNVAYVKQHQVMFGAIVIVFALVLYTLLHRGGSAAGSTVMVGTAQPTDAQVAAGAQLQLAGIQAAAQSQAGQIQLAALQEQQDGQYAIATLELQSQLATTAANERMNNANLSASVEALHAQLDNSLSVTDSNNAFMVDYAKVAADSATTQLLIGAALQRDLSAQQLEAYKIGTNAQIVQMAYARASINKNNTASLNAATDIAKRFLTSTGAGT